MKKYRLKIENDKTKLNEVEIGIDQIIKSTGVEDTASAINQLTKMASASVKLALGVVFSFRSLSIKQITANINQANKNYSSRVRRAMRSLDKTVDDLGKNSMSSKAFAYSAPIFAITDHLRSQVDNAGGLYNYLQDQSQNLIVGDIFSSVYDVYESAIKKSLNIKEMGLELSEEEIKNSVIAQIRKDFRINFGQESVEVLDDVIYDRDTPRAQELVDLASDEYANGNQMRSAIYGYFNNIKNRSNESFKFQKSRIIISEKKFKKTSVYTKDQKLSVIAAIADVIDYQDKVVKSVFSDPSIEEKSTKDDVKIYSTVLEVLICDHTIFTLANNFINTGEIKEQKIKSEIKKLSEIKIEKESSQKINQFIDDVFIKLEEKNKAGVALFILGSIKSIDNENIYINNKVKDYIDSINEYSNSKDDDFTKLKSGVNKIYNKNSKVKIPEVIIKINNIVKDLEDSKEDENNKTT